MKKFFATILILNFLNLNVLAYDDALRDNLIDTLNKDLKIQKQAPVVYEDNVVKNMKENFIYAKGNSNQKFDFESLDEQVVKITPAQYYTTRTNLAEGDLINFVLAQDVTIKNKLYKKGTKVIARVENLSQNGARGVPADLVIDNFVLAPNVKLAGSIEKKGANRSLWLYPTSSVLIATIIFSPAGLLMLPIRGGHAKLKPNHVYNLNYIE